jgi:release factor glutamine methyltransferase
MPVAFTVVNFIAPLTPISLPATWAQCLSDCALPKLEARILLEWVSGQSRSWLTIHQSEPLPIAVAQRFVAAVERRLAGQPLAYVMGEREFYGLVFAVSPATLIPRADTEVLVDWLIANAPQQARLLELGTGTGCIAISVAYHRPDIHWLATDIDPAALQVAQANAQRIGVTQTIQWLLSDWYQSVPAISTKHRFDGIVSNPPYIAANDIHLTQGDLRFEPQGALSDGFDGSNDLRHIIEGAKPFLKPNGFVALEHGFEQARLLHDIFAKNHFENSRTYPDLATRDRFSVAFNHP